MGLPRRAPLPNSSGAWRRYDRIGTVFARRLAASREWHANGELLSADPGDYWVWEQDEAQGRSVKPDEFESSHRPIEASATDEAAQRYLRTGTFEARQLAAPEEAATLEGVTRGVPGMWRVRDLRGNEWFVQDDIFHATYQLSDDEHE